MTEDSTEHGTEEGVAWHCSQGSGQCGECLDYDLALYRISPAQWQEMYRRIWRLLEGKRA
jgi:hypothetical protein